MNELMKPCSSFLQPELCHLKERPSLGPDAWTLLAAELREILEGGNPRKLKTFQKMPYAGENGGQKRRHTCQDEKPRLKKEQ